MDELLFQTKTSIYWRPERGRSIGMSQSYRDFEDIVRTVHLKDAVKVYKTHKFNPNPVSGRSALKSFGHPCRDIKILWFGPSRMGRVDMPDWYGNVQFTVSANLLVEWWNYFYLVEMETKEKHTTTRVLITNKNYSSDLPRYNPYLKGGPWYICNGKHHVLLDCSRYNDIGRNMNGHILEFMIELSPEQQCSLLDECIMTFRNHSEAGGLLSEGDLQRCHISRIQRSICPSPLTRDEAILQFASKYNRSHTMERPRMSDIDEQLFAKYVKQRERPGSLQKPAQLISDRDLTSHPQRNVIFEAHGPGESHNEYNSYKTCRQEKDKSSHLPSEHISKRVLPGHRQNTDYRPIAAQSQRDVLGARGRGESYDTYNSYGTCRQEKDQSWSLTPYLAILLVGWCIYKSIK